MFPSTDNNGIKQLTDKELQNIIQVCKRQLERRRNEQQIKNTLEEIEQCKIQ